METVQCVAYEWEQSLAIFSMMVAPVLFAVMLSGIKFATHSKIPVIVIIVPSYCVAFSIWIYVKYMFFDFGCFLWPCSFLYALMVTITSASETGFLATQLVIATFRMTCVKYNRDNGVIVQCDHHRDHELTICDKAVAQLCLEIKESLNMPFNREIGCFSDMNVTISKNEIVGTLKRPIRASDVNFISETLKTYGYEMQIADTKTGYITVNDYPEDDVLENRFYTKFRFRQLTVHEIGELAHRCSKGE